MIQLYDSSSEYTFYWLDINGNKACHDFDDFSADEILDNIEDQLKLLQKHKLFEKESWTQCRVTLSDKGKFNIKFAYIPWEGSWPGLYMKGVSELSYEGADNLCSIPKEEWEKRQKYKNYSN